MITVHYLKAVKYYDGKMYCPDCHDLLYMNLTVKLSTIDTLSHIDCCSTLKEKDRGTLREMIKRYPCYFPTYSRAKNSN